MPAKSGGQTKKSSSSSILFMGSLPTSSSSSSSSTPVIPASPLRSQRPLKQQQQQQQQISLLTFTPQKVNQPHVVSSTSSKAIVRKDTRDGKDGEDNDEDDDLSLGESLEEDEGEGEDQDHCEDVEEEDELGEGLDDDISPRRPLTPTSAIAAAFTRLQEKVRRLERIKNEHALCSERVTRIETKALETLTESERKYTIAEKKLQIQQSASETALLRLEKEMNTRIRELEAALVASQKEVAEGNALLSAARDVFENQARGEANTARRAWDEGFAAAEKKAAEETVNHKIQITKLLSLKETECEKERTTVATLRNEIAMMRGELAAVKARSASMILPGGACSRCKDFELPPPTTSGNNGPWYTIEEVKNVITNAAGVKLVVLAPTVNVSVAAATAASTTTDILDLNKGEGEGEFATLKSSIESEAIFGVLEKEILPRYAAAFALPGLHSRVGGKGGGLVEDYRKGPEKDKDLESWLQKLMHSLEDSVTEKLRASGGINVLSREHSLG